MHKNRPFTFILLILLSLDLLFFFTSRPTRCGGEAERVEQEVEEILEGFAEAEEEIEEESEFLTGGLPLRKLTAVGLACEISRRQPYVSAVRPSALSCGWRLPLRI